MTETTTKAADANVEPTEQVGLDPSATTMPDFDWKSIYAHVAKLNPPVAETARVGDGFNVSNDSDRVQDGQSNDGRKDKPFKDFLDSSDFQRQLREIKNYSQSPRAQRPEDVAIRAINNSDVVAFGETHEGENPFREFGANILKTLKENGATHFAIEAVGIPGIQDAIAEFNRTGDIGKLKGIFPPTAQEQEDYFKLLKSARDAGLEVVVADKPDAEPRSHDRDKAMADTIKKILDNPRGDGTKNKVVFWVGSDHLQGIPDSAAGFLRSDGINLTTVKGVIPEDRKGVAPSPLAEATETIERPTAIDSKRFPWLKDTPLNFGVFDRDRRESEFNHIFLFPKK